MPRRWSSSSSDAQRLDRIRKLADERLPDVERVFAKLPAGSSVGLYCGSYGGFGLTDHFEEWCEQQEESKNKAVLAVAYGFENVQADYCKLRMVYVPPGGICRCDEYDGLQTPRIEAPPFEHHARDLLLLARGEKRLEDLPARLQEAIASPIKPGEYEALFEKYAEQAEPVMAELYKLAGCNVKKQIRAF